MDLEELRFQAAGWMIRTDGAATGRARFLSFVRARGFDGTEAEVDAVLDEAQVDFGAHAPRVFACLAEPCRHKLGVDVKTLPIVPTGCQGICKQAPVAAARVGEHLRRFGQVVTEHDWRAVLALATNTAGHEHAGPSPALAPLSFLIGHFSGDGRFARDGQTFEKELVGSYEAGGRFISLRMEARYHVPEGGCDVHRALVILGAEPKTGRILGRSYTDGGTQREYVIERAERAWAFDDAPPDHVAWQRVRKTLEPTTDGYEERLEVDGGSGLFGYCNVTMRKRAAA